MLAWAASSQDGGAPLSHYIIEIRDAIKAEWREVAKVNQFTTHFKLQDELTPDADYFVRVRARNEAGFMSSVASDFRICSVVSYRRRVSIASMRP